MLSSRRFGLPGDDLHANIPYFTFNKPLYYLKKYVDRGRIFDLILTCFSIYIDITVPTRQSHTGREAGSESHGSPFLDRPSEIAGLPETEHPNEQVTCLAPMKEGVEHPRWRLSRKGGPFVAGLKRRAEDEKSAPLYYRSPWFSCSPWWLSTHSLAV
jgi:hypothetical protein